MSNTINKQSAATPQLSDLIAIWDSVNSDTRNTSLNRVFELFSESFTNAVLEADSQYSTPLTGANVLVNDNNNDTHLIVVPAGTIAALTITLPAKVNIRDKQTLLVNCTQIVTALTVAANGASAVNGAPTAFTANGFFTLKYDLTLDTWSRVG